MYEASRDLKNLYAALDAGLANVRGIANTIRDLTGDDVPARLDLDYGTSAGWNGMGSMRGDGAVRLEGWDQFVAESLNSSNEAEKRWATEDGQKAPWFFIIAALEHPDLNDRSKFDEAAREAVRFQISTNCSNARMRQANFGVPSSELARSPWFAFFYEPDGRNGFIEGNLIQDARSLPDDLRGSGGSVFLGATPKMARDIAKAVRARWILSKALEAHNHGWGGVWTGM